MRTVITNTLRPRKWPKRAILEVFWTFLERAGWDLLRFAPNVVQTVPVRPARSDWMPHFDEGYLENSCGVCPPNCNGGTEMSIVTPQPGSYICSFFVISTSETSTTGLAATVAASLEAPGGQL